MWEQIEPVLMNFIVVLLSGVLSLLSAFLIALAKKGFDWLKAKIENVKEITMQNRLKSALDYLQNLVEVTVTSLQQTLGEDIKNSLKEKDSVYTRADLLALKDRAMYTIKSQLKDSAINVLTTAYENIDDLIADMIETQVYQLKLFAPISNTVEEQ